MEILMLLIALILILGLLDFTAMRWGKSSQQKDAASDRELAALLMNEHYSNLTFR
jgi:nitrogen fixation-related uncharacterized protein